MKPKYDPAKHHRNSIRLKDYDYGQSGAYFITIVTQKKICLFGDVNDSASQLNDAGQMIRAVWVEMSRHYPGVETDTFVVMPNHIHGIILLVGAGPRACPESSRVDRTGQPQGVAPTISLPEIVHRFKTLTTKRYTDGVKHSAWTRFQVRLWQRNYYEHVIRDEDSLTRIREYIFNNPAQWAFDPENPAATATESPHVWRLQQRPDDRGDQTVAPTKDLRIT